jgi:hypothetical protein
VNVRRATRIGHGTYGAKAIEAVAVGHGGAVTLKVRIRAAAIARMVVVAESIALPDLDARAGNRPSARVENPPDHMRYGTLRRHGPTGDLDQVGVGIERQRERIEWPGSLLRRRRQGREPRLRQCQRGGGKRRCQKSPTIEHHQGLNSPSPPVDSLCTL